MYDTNAREEIIRLAMNNITNGNDHYSCCAISNAADKLGFPIYGKDLRASYACFYGKMSCLRWFPYDTEEDFTENKNQRLTMLALFLVAKGDL